MCGSMIDLFIKQGFLKWTTLDKKLKVSKTCRRNDGAVVFPPPIFSPATVMELQEDSETSPSRQNKPKKAKKEKTSKEDDEDQEKDENLKKRSRPILDWSSKQKKQIEVDTSYSEGSGEYDTDDNDDMFKNRSSIINTTRTLISKLRRTTTTRRSRSRTTFSTMTLTNIGQIQMGWIGTMVHSIRMNYGTRNYMIWIFVNGKVK
jgi:hypothetical protein